MEGEWCVSAGVTRRILAMFFSAVLYICGTPLSISLVPVAVNLLINNTKDCIHIVLISAVLYLVGVPFYVSLIPITVITFVLDTWARLDEAGAFGNDAEYHKAS